MKSKSNKKFSSKFFSTTKQELAVKQLLRHEKVPFLFQKEFNLSDRRYVVDFFIANTIVLECSATTMHKYDIALKQKAVHLEAKASQLKQHFPYSILVLFESRRPIGPQLLKTLTRLMPSVDEILTSRYQLLEILRVVLNSPQSELEKTILKGKRRSAYTQNEDRISPGLAQYPMKECLLDTNQLNFPRSVNYTKRTIDLPILPLVPINNYSHIMNKNFIGENTVSQSSKGFFQEGYE